MGEKKFEDFLFVPGKKKLKTMLAGLTFWFLGRGFQAVAALDPKVREEIAGWPDTFTMVMRIQPFGPSLVMGKRNGKFIYLGSKEQEADLTVYFKNIEVALPVLLGLSGIDRAFAEHRLSLKGDIIAYAMPLTRCLYMVETYLFPAFIARRILKRLPRKKRSSLRIYMRILLGV
ncbi:MAG: SCP2 sterol-binding domain-containing protein [Peptococcaceae bacterium]|nr:SCP2 sterol-binding domain-containing protein [Peptococcaceae bacterium]